jgi:hypothetical protein
MIYSIKSIYEIENISISEIMKIIFDLKSPLELGASKSGEILKEGTSKVISEGIHKAQYGILKPRGYQKLYSEAGTLLGYVFDPNKANNREMLTEALTKQIQTHKTNLRYWIDFGNKYIKYIPIIGSIIGGFIDSYGMYKVGQKAIKLFEEKIKLDKGCGSILSRKEKINLCFQYIDELSNMWLKLVSFPITFNLISI